VIARGIAGVDVLIRRRPRRHVGRGRGRDVARLVGRLFQGQQCRPALLGADHPGQEVAVHLGVGLDVEVDAPGRGVEPLEPTYVRQGQDRRAVLAGVPRHDHRPAVLVRERLAHLVAEHPALLHALHRLVDDRAEDPHLPALLLVRGVAEPLELLAVELPDDVADPVVVEVEAPGDPRHVRLVAVQVRDPLPLLGVGESLLLGADAHRALRAGRCQGGSPSGRAGAITFQTRDLREIIRRYAFRIPGCDNPKTLAAVRWDMPRSSAAMIARSRRSRSRRAGVGGVGRREEVAEVPGTRSIAA
jgi:hypothetical protein